ncbi:MAG TPA: glycosyl hydrolase family 65 protein, partial [Flavisolibacter sp.]
LHPLIPEGQWNWFRLENVKYHNKMLTFLWDKDGTKYGEGRGFQVFADGKKIYQGKSLKPVKIKSCV